MNQIAIKERHAQASVCEGGGVGVGVGVGLLVKWGGQGVRVSQIGVCVSQI